MSPALLSLLTFLAVVLAVVGVYSLLSDLFLRDRTRVSQRVSDEFRQRQRDRVRKQALFKNRDTGTSEPEDDRMEPGLQRRFESLVEQSGMDVTPRRLLIIMACTGLGLGLVGFVFGRSILVGLGIAVLASGLPLLYVVHKRKVRLEKLMSQLPDAFDLMARIIRAGQTMSQALQAVADEFDPPIASEFAYCYEQQNLGLSPEFALRDLSRRTGLLEIKIFVLAVLVQQQTGGNLAELLDKLATVIRERSRIRGKIRSLTAEGRIQALVLLALPPVLLLAILVLNRDYALTLFQHPYLLVGMVVSELIGAVWIQRIVNFDF